MKNEIISRQFDDTFEAFSRSEILIAADVIYDADAIDPLINVVKCFLAESPTSRKAIFSSTKRNAATFEYFLETIRKYDMTYTWLVRNEDCDSLVKIFEGNYIQKRSDVQICSIQLDTVQKKSTAKSFVPQLVSTMIVLLLSIIIGLSTTSFTAAFFN